MFGKQPPKPKPDQRVQTAAPSAKIWHPEQGWRPGESREGGHPVGKNNTEPIPGNAAAPDAGGSLSKTGKGYSVIHELFQQRSSAFSLSPCPEKEPQEGRRAA